MRKEIPAPLISACAELVSVEETHASMESLFLYAGASVETSAGNKLTKAIEWLRQTNKDSNIDPLTVLGKILESYLDESDDSRHQYNSEQKEEYLTRKKRVIETLEKFNLHYVTGGKFLETLGSPTKSLEDLIRSKDIRSIDIEFDRALKNVIESPREAVSAASNILESICKVYIEIEILEKPSKQDLKSVWNIVRKDLKLDPSNVEDQDLQKILSGLISIVEGLGALRTHASSAHGGGLKPYKLEPRHAKLCIHSAHTLALFILETWDKRSQVK